jgi:hypothetical protein
MSFWRDKSTRIPHHSVSGDAVQDASVEIFRLQPSRDSGVLGFGFSCLGVRVQGEGDLALPE